MRTPTPKFPGRYFINDRLKAQGKTLKWLHEQLAQYGIEVRYNHLSSYVGDVKGGQKGDTVCRAADIILKKMEERNTHDGT